MSRAAYHPRRGAGPALVCLAPGARFHEPFEVQAAGPSPKSVLIGARVLVLVVFASKRWLRRRRQGPG